MIRLSFWTATAGLVYSYVVFPLLLLARGALRPRPHAEADMRPSVTVIVPAYNEAGRIAKKLRSIAHQDYAGRVSVVVASDGSDDGTPAIAAGLDLPDVHVLELPRSGKAAAIAAAVEMADGEILVLSDANSILAPDAIRRIVRPFADPEVGGVAGNQVYVRADDIDAVAVGERSYWDFDRALKRAQSRAGNVIAGTGALYAIRRRHFRSIPPGVNDDFFLSLAVIDAGDRLVFEPGAIAYEPVSGSRGLEYARRVRIMTRGLRCAVAIPGVLDPRRTGFYALQVISHKLLMRAMAVPLAVVAATSALLARRGRIYRLAAGAQLSFYALAVMGFILARRGIGHHPLLALPAYFSMVQVASLHAVWNLLRGRSYDRWRTERATGSGGRPAGAAPPAAAADAATTAGRDGGAEVAAEARAT